MDITIEDLENLITLHLNNSTKKEAFQLILETMIDWPYDNVTTLNSLFSSIEKRLGSNLNSEQILQISQSIDLAKNPWLAESLESLIQLFNIHGKESNLKEIFQSVSLLYENIHDTEFPSQTE